MRIQEMEKFYDQELPEYIFAVRFDLRHEDVLLSAKLLKAADKEEWTSVTELLKQGADPRICRVSDGSSCESALYLAMRAKEFKIARMLFEAGDRLDDLCCGETAIPADMLEFLAREAACGHNYFIEEDKPLSECVRCNLWTQIEKKIASASQEELNLSVAMTGFSLRNWNAADCLKILRDLQKYGADIAQFREELPAQWERFKKWPVCLRPAEDIFRQIIKLIREA